KKTDDWLKRIGEPPQIYDEVLSERSENQLKQFASNKGYFEAVVNSTIKKNVKKQKADVKFNVVTGQRYYIRDVKYHIPDTAMESLFLQSKVKEQINPGDAFDVFNLEEQQLNIVELFRNNGYYFFSKDDIKFLADTTSYSRQILLDLYIGGISETRTDSVKTFNKYYLNNFYISVLPGNTPVTANRDTIRAFSDTTRWDNYTLYQNEMFNYPPALFNRTMQIKQGDLFNNLSVKNTFTAFNLLRQFRFVDIQFDLPEASRDTNLLDCKIRLAPLNKQSTSFDIEGTNTSGNFGIAGNVTYQHRNLFSAAEVFQLKFRGATERLQYSSQGQRNNFNTRELGVESSLMIPRLLGPGNFINNFEKFLPKTVFTLGYNYQKRPEYTRTITNFKMGYDWKTSEDLRHVWNLLDFNLVDVFEYDPAFIEGIEDLYIKSSFTDHLIMAMNYSLIYNNQKLNVKRNYTYVRFNVESAGNVLWSISELTNRPKHQDYDSTGVFLDEYYKALNTRFAQYIKSDIEVSHSQMFDEYNSIVTRAFVGVGLPYGNFDLLPFEKQYFTGGANGIRAWQVRSLGPGSYRAPEGAYPNQSSDIKLEANVEYRFKLTNFLEGALFVDAGNIWAINEKDNRPGAQFKFNQFYKQIAMGTGVGMRFDLKYFIFRLDLGLKVRDPSAEKGQKWIIGSRPLTNDDLHLSFAIGYPF
ncbi:BamA/TamA family outer membrane protein, partial [Draconibacterium sp.]|nr:BamA/TamA family outer membrane protein [Draconibacterium sp.]